MDNYDAAHKVNMALLGVPSVDEGKRPSILSKLSSQDSTSGKRPGLMSRMASALSINLLGAPISGRGSASSAYSRRESESILTHLRKTFLMYDDDEDDDDESDEREHELGFAHDSVRGKLHALVEHQSFNVLIVALVILDIVFVMCELLLDLRMLEHALHMDHHLEHQIATVFHILSMVILCLFVVEYLVKIYVMRCRFLRYVMECFDLVVVVGAIALESLYHHSYSLADATGLLLVLRLWRITRIASGIIRSVKIRAKNKFRKERNARLEAEEKLECAQRQAEALERELGALSQAVQKTLSRQQRAELKRAITEELRRNKKRFSCDSDAQQHPPQLQGSLQQQQDNNNEENENERIADHLVGNIPRIQVLPAAEEEPETPKIDAGCYHKLFPTLKSSRGPH